MTDWESKCLSGMCDSLDLIHSTMKTIKYAFICFLFCLNDSFSETGSSYYSWGWTWILNPPASTPANAQLIFVVVFGWEKVLLYSSSCPWSFSNLSNTDSSCWDYSWVTKLELFLCNLWFEICYELNELHPPKLTHWRSNLYFLKMSIFGDRVLKMTIKLK